MLGLFHGLVCSVFVCGLIFGCGGGGVGGLFFRHVSWRCGFLSLCAVGILSTVPRYYFFKESGSFYSGRIYFCPCCVCVCVCSLKKQIDGCIWGYCADTKERGFVF